MGIPSLGIKVDCVPGRLNTIEFKIARTGLFYGQCSEICGTQHGFMPICIVLYLKNVFFNQLNNLFNLGYFFH